MLSYRCWNLSLLHRHGSRLHRLAAVLSLLATGLPPLSAAQPTAADAAKIQPYVDAIQAATDEKRYTEAIALADTAVRRFPESSEAYRSRAMAYRLSKNLPAAITDYDRSLQLNPANVRALTGRAYCRQLLKDLPGALADFNHALDLDARSVVVFDARASLKREMGDFKGALADASSAIALGGEKPEYYLRRGPIRQSLKDYPAMEADFDHAVRLDPKSLPGYFGRAVARAALGNHAAAIADYERCIAANFRVDDSTKNRDKSQRALSQPAGAVIAQTAPTLARAAAPALASGAASPISALDKIGAFLDAAAAIADAVAETKPSLKPTAGPAEPATSTTSSATAPHPPAANAPAATSSVQPAPRAPAKSVASSSSTSSPPKPASTDKVKEPAGAAKPPATKPPPKSEPKPEPKSKALGAEVKPLPPVELPATATGYYKLVKTSMPAKSDPNGAQKSYGGQGTTSSYTESSTTDGQSYSSTVQWSIPDKIVPGMPLKFRIAGSELDNWTFGHISILIGDSIDRILVGVRMAPPRGDLPPNVLSDEFEFVLPKEINQWKKAFATSTANQELTLRLRDNGDMEEIVINGETLGMSPLIPSQVKIEDFKTALNMLVIPEKGPIDIRIRVFASRSVATYTYSWEGPPDANGDGHIKIAPEPATKTELRADGRDSVVVKARALAVGNEKPESVLRKTQSITFSAFGPGSDWVDFGESKMVGEWKHILVQAMNPNVVRGSANKPPPNLGLRATLKDGAQTYAQNLLLKVPPNAELDAKPDPVEFTIKSGLALPVKVAIANPGPDRWTFRAEYDKKARQLATIVMKPVDAGQVLLTLKEAGLDPPHDGANTESAVLKIFADQKGRESLERDITVLVAQEGLFVANTGRDDEAKLFKVYANGKGRTTDIDFRLFVQDAATKKIQNLTKRAEVLSSISVEALEVKDSVAGRLLEAGHFNKQLAGIRASNEPSGILRLSFPKELPSDGRIVPCDLRIRYQGRTETAFTAIVTIGIVTSENGPGSRDWQIELGRCQEVITRFMPATYQAKMQALLDKRKMTLGPEGLHQLRNKIWMVAAELTLAEGARGYEDEARWANYITEFLEWSQWAGDMAFGAVLGTYLGPYGSFASTQLKSLIISAINAYQDGQSAEEWLWGNLCTIPGILEGKVIDVDTFEKLGVESKAKVWAIYVSYHFLKNLYNGQTVIEALKNTAKEAGGNVLAGWLSAEVKKNGNRSVGTWAAEKKTAAGNAISSAVTQVNQKLAPAAPPKPPAAADSGPAAPAPKRAGGDEPELKRTASADEAAPAKPAATTEAESAAQVRRRTTQAADGKLYAHPDDVLEIMQDPSKVRALKSAPPEVQQAFSNTREAIYRQHDAEVVQHVKDTMPDMKYRMVKVMEFRTPGDTGLSLNTDRDYRVCYYAGRNPNTGKEQWIEVPRKHWEDKSYDAFARLTGGPTGSAERSREWAAQHQQLGTDKFHVEASGAFSDQKKVWNEKTRKFDDVQVTSNFEKVAKLQLDGVDIQDPQSLGQMYQVKVSDAKHPHEAFVQANKAVNALTALRNAYGAQGRKTGQLPVRVLAGMQAVAKVNEQLKADPNRRDPVAIAEAETTLKANGFNDLTDFMNKMSGQFESLKTMEQN